MTKRLLSESGITLVVVLLLMAILLSIVGAGLLFSGINTKITVNYQSGTRAFYAADAGIGQAISQVSANPLTAVAAFGPVDLGDGLKYRTGSRTAASPQPMQFVGTRQEAGYSLNTGTGYNASGYNFYQYQINVTGTYEVAGVEVAGARLRVRPYSAPCHSREIYAKSDCDRTNFCISLLELLEFHAGLGG
ncbi:MAG TPA: pilus assembly PilX N-terminal domain-containing protein [Candidatus Binatia bacterium]|nr:pilus assembly PilX N-terminal domain-containing protein [Candidatus Binatia bacterium]